METQYDKDFKNWQREQSKQGDFISSPNRNDYDNNGFKKGEVTYEGTNVLDPYLIEIYGIDYARKNPICVLEKNLEETDD